MINEDEDRRYMSSVAPPTEPGLVEMPRGPSSWPKVVGIIAIVLGVGGILGGLSGALSPLMLDAMASMMPQGQAVVAAIEEMAGWTVAVSLASAVVAGVLLAGGIGLLKRRRWSVRITRIWAFVRLLLVIANAVLTYQMTKAQFEVMSQQQPGAAAMPAGFGGVVGTISVAFGVIWGWAFPVFVLIWLARGKIKAETSAWD